METLRIFGMMCCCVPVFVNLFLICRWRADF